MKNLFVKIFLIIFFLIAAIGILPSILATYNLVKNYEYYTNIDEYKKMYVMIDSANYESGGIGSKRGIESLICYSRDLNNYKTPISYNITIINDQEKNINWNIDGKTFQYIWYKKRINYATPANKEDKVFPRNKHLFYRIWLPILCFISIFLTCTLNKIAEKSGLYIKK
jgi:hypothetical protein